MGNIYGYMRISTAQERGKQKFTRQENALLRYAKENSFEYILMLKEDKSGKDFKSRTEWQRLEKLLHPGDTIVFKDICRFTRQTEEGYAKYTELLAKGIELI